MTAAVSPTTDLPPVDTSAPPRPAAAMSDAQASRHAALVRFRSRRAGTNEELAEAAARAVADIWIHTAPPRHPKSDISSFGQVVRCVIDDAALHDGTVDIERALHRAPASRWAARQTTSISTRRKYLASVEAAGKIVHPDEFPVPAPVAPRPPVRQPASEETIFALYAASHTVSELLGHRVRMALDLSTGAGARTAEMAGLTGSDVEPLTIGGTTVCLVRLKNHRGSRCVPVLEEAKAIRLLSAARTAGGGPLIAGTAARRVERIPEDWTRRGMTPRMQLDRLRSAWLVHMIDIGLTCHEMLEFGDLGDSHTIADLRKWLLRLDATASTADILSRTRLR